MRYIQETILKNEKLIYITRPHWIIFGFSACILLIALLLYAFAPYLFRSIGYFELFGLYLYQWLALLIFLFGLISGLGAYITYVTSEYGITDRRILMKTGWIQRKSLEVFLDKIEAVKVDQSVLGRILNYGTIVIIGTGGTSDPFIYIPDPLGFRRKVQQQIDIFSHHNH